MSESFSWPDGSINAWTGTATASAAVGFAENSQVTLTRGWDNRPNLSGQYRNHLTGQMAQVSIGILTTLDWTLFRMFESASTAVHLHLKQTGVGGASGGLLLYSGVIDSMALQGSEGNLYKWAINYHCNTWSGYGGFS